MHRFSAIAFTPAVRAAQVRLDPRDSYGDVDLEVAEADGIGAAEAGFIAARDGFYMASVGATGWPYIQFRGGPAGFLKVLGPHTLGFADLRGNRQYISVGNLAGESRVALFLMDYAARRRLKVLARARVVEAADDPALMARLVVGGGKAERAVVLEVEGLDWNCPQHIPRRFTEAEVERLVERQVTPLVARIAELERENAGLRTGQG